MRRTVYIVAPFSQKGPEYYKVKARARRDMFKADMSGFRIVRKKHLKKYLKNWEGEGGAK